MNKYQGIVNVGSEIRASFLPDAATTEPIQLFISAAAKNNPSVSDVDAVVPPNAGQVSVRTIGRGRLEIAVDTASEADGGQLTVFEDGTVRNDEPVTGDTVWVYTILP